MKTIDHKAYVHEIWDYIGRDTVISAFNKAKQVMQDHLPNSEDVDCIYTYLWEEGLGKQLIATLTRKEEYRALIACPFLIENTTLSSISVKLSLCVDENSMGYIPPHRYNETLDLWYIGKPRDNRI